VRGEFRREAGQGGRWLALERAKPKGGFGRSFVLNARRSAGTPEGVKARKPVSARPARRPSASRNNGRLTARGFNRGGNAGVTLQVDKTPKGEIPGALSARNKAGAGLGGANRREGSQTLRAEPSG
jgi:hypothetical protein